MIRAPHQTDAYVEGDYEPELEPVVAQRIDRGPWCCASCGGDWPEGQTSCTCGGRTWTYPHLAAGGAS